MDFFFQSKENEISHKQQRAPTQSDFVDETFYHQIEERAKKADQDRREAARRARDYYHRQSSELNVCFDTDNQTIFTLQPIPLNSSISTDKKVKIELDEKDTPAFPISSSSSDTKDSKEEEEPLPPRHQRSYEKRILFYIIISSCYLEKH